MTRRKPAPTPAGAPAVVWPADRVERRETSSLVPYARNARTHTPEQVAELAASIVQWGRTIPVLIDEQGVLIAGHGRVLAALELGLPSIPAMVAEGWSEAQIKAYRLADNQLALNAGWDGGLAKIELAELQLAGFETKLIGFTPLDLKAFGGGAIGTDEGGGGRTASAGNYQEQYGVIVLCADEASQEAIYDQLKGMGIGTGVRVVNT